MEEVLEQAAAALLYVCNHKWKNKIGSAAQDVSHPPARPRPPVGTRGKTLICFVSLEQNERLLANRV